MKWVTSITPKTILLKPVPLVWVLLLVLAFSMGIVTLIRNAEMAQRPAGRIVFSGDLQPPYTDRFPPVYLMDADGGHKVVLGRRFSGSPAWSPAGKWLALGCADPDWICILDPSGFFNDFTYPPKKDFISYGNYDPVQKLPLPEDCLSIDLERRKVTLDWSPEGERLVMTCHSLYTDEANKICILGSTGSQRCWDYSDRDYTIINAAWAPAQDLFAITVDTKQGPKILLDNPGGEKTRILADGWSAKWSPDGKSMAFMRYADGVITVQGDQVEWYPYLRRSGLALMNLNGVFQRWLIAPEEDLFKDGKTPNDQEVRLRHIGFNDCAGTYCQITWSPDGRYILFSADYGMYGNYQQLMRYDLWTQEIYFPTKECVHCGPPAWGDYP